MVTMNGGGVGGPFRTWAEQKTNEHGDPLDVPKRSKWEVGYVLPPPETPIQCGSCVHFRPPDGCAVVGNEGALIHPEGCCDLWAAEGMLPSTPEDPNPGDEDLYGASEDAEEEPKEPEKPIRPLKPLGRSTRPPVDPSDE